MNTKIIQFTSGRGPLECEYVVGKVLKYFLKQATNNGYEYTILHKEDGNQNGTVQSVTIQLKGKQLGEFLSNWIGTIQWIGTSTFRKHHKRKNWFIGCFEVEQAEQLKLNEKDIRFQAVRSSGAGGQHVNKVSSAVRAIHQPTNIQVLVMDTRSQHQNKRIAIERLQQKVAEYNLKLLQNSIENQWNNNTQLERGNAVQTFTGSDFKPKKEKKKSYKNKRNELKKELRNMRNF